PSRGGAPSKRFPVALMKRAIGADADRSRERILTRLATACALSSSLVRPLSGDTRRAQPTPRLGEVIGRYPSGGVAPWPGGRSTYLPPPSSSAADSPARGSGRPQASKSDTETTPSRGGNSRISGP